LRREAGRKTNKWSAQNTPCENLFHPPHRMPYTLPVTPCEPNPQKLRCVYGCVPAVNLSG